MAFINENPLFSINGKIGRYVIRKFNGKKMIAKRPLHYKKTTSKLALEYQKRFSIVSRFAKQVNSNPVLSTIWKNSNVKGFSAYHKIIKANMKHVTENGLDVSNIMVPRSFYNLIQDISLRDNLLVCTFDDMFLINHSIRNDRLYLFVIFSFFNYSKSREPKHDVKLVSQFFILRDDSNISSLQIVLVKNIIQQIKRCKKCILFSTLVWQSNNKLEWNASFAKMI